MKYAERDANDCLDSGGMPQTRVTHGLLRDNIWGHDTEIYLNRPQRFSTSPKTTPKSRQIIRRPDIGLRKKNEGHGPKELIKLPGLASSA